MKPEHIFYMVVLAATILMAERNMCPGTWTPSYGCEKVQVTNSGVEL